MREGVEWNETDGYGKTWKTDDKKIRLMWKSQCAAIGVSIKKVWDYIRMSELSDAEKDEYCASVKQLYEDVENDELKWEKVQEVMFKSGLSDKIKYQFGVLGDNLINELSTQYVMLQLEQWNKEEEAENK